MKISFHKLKVVGIGATCLNPALMPSLDHSDPQNHIWRDHVYLVKKITCISQRPVAKTYMKKKWPCLDAPCPYIYSLQCHIPKKDNLMNQLRIEPVPYVVEIMRSTQCYVCLSFYFFGISLCSTSKVQHKGRGKHNFQWSDLRHGDTYPFCHVHWRI